MIDLFSLIFSPLTPYRPFLITSILVLAWLTVVLLVVMIVHKSYVEYREARSARHHKKYESSFALFLGNQEEHLPHPRHSLSVDALADVAVEQLALADRDCAERIRSELRICGVVDNLLERLKTSRSWVSRFHSLERLGFLKLPELRPIYLELLTKEKDLRIISKTLWALSYVAEVDDLPLLTDFLGNTYFMSAKFNEYLFINLLGEFRRRLGDDKVVTVLETVLNDGNIPVLVKRDIIEACGKTGFSRCVTLVIDAFHRYREVPEMRITTLRAAGELSNDSVCEILGQSFSDEDWRVRVVASQYARKCPNSCVSCMEELLSDHNYHVRMNAARTLATRGEEGKLALTRALSGNDRFARDISRYALDGR